MCLFLEMESLIRYYEINIKMLSFVYMKFKWPILTFD